jgi:hypothetical protein
MRGLVLAPLCSLRQRSARNRFAFHTKLGIIAQVLWRQAARDRSDHRLARNSPTVPGLCPIEGRNKPSPQSLSGPWGLAPTVHEREWELNLTHERFREWSLYLLLNLRSRDKPLWLVGAGLEGANLQGADLHGANLGEADLSGADLRGASLTKATLSGAVLEGVDLRMANLSEANLHGANVRNASLEGANLRWTILSDASLRGAALSRATLYRANLSGADLTGAKVTAKQLSEVASLTGAILPDGTLRA